MKSFITEEKRLAIEKAKLRTFTAVNMQQMVDVVLYKLRVRILNILWTYSSTEKVALNAHQNLFQTSLFLLFFF